MKDTKLYFLVVALLRRDNKKLLKLLGKGFERSAYSSEYKTKCENKNTKVLYRCFLVSTFLEVNRLYVLVYSNQGSDSKRFKTKRY